MLACKVGTYMNELLPLLFDCAFHEVLVYVEVFDLLPFHSFFLIAGVDLWVGRLEMVHQAGRRACTYSHRRLTFNTHSYLKGRVSFEKVPDGGRGGSIASNSSLFFANGQYVGRRR